MTMTQLQKQLETISKKFKEIKNSGVDEELLVCFIKDKTKLSKRSIRLMLTKQAEFYNKLVSKEVAEAL